MNKPSYFSDFEDPKVAKIFESYPSEVQDKLLKIRQLIFVTAAESKGVGKITETLKWGQPSYLTSETKSGTTIRLDQIGSEEGKFALYLHCQTSLIESYREIFHDKLKFEDNRAIIFDITGKIPEYELKICINMAQRYHLDK